MKAVELGLVRSDLRAQSLPVLGAEGPLAVPLSTYRYNSWTDASGDYRWSYEYVSKLMLVEVNETSGELSVYGEVDHSLFFDAEDGRWWGGETQIRRSIFMGDFVVALSQVA